MEEDLLRVLRDRTAGDPMRQEVRWADLGYEQIAAHLAEAGTKVSVPVVEQPLEKHGHVTRKAQKAKAMGGHPDRNRQLEDIARLRREYLGSGDPIVSMDTKEKGLIGDFHRPGRIPTRGVIETFDRDFPSFAEGVVIPHGLYDVRRNEGHANPGAGHDTGEFARESIGRWWEEKGRAPYPRARSILLLCDGGGSNGASRHPFKEDLQKLVDRLGVEIRVEHHPPCCSKYNPIEHRLSPHLTRARQGVIFESVGLVKGSMERASTVTGPRVTVDILDEVYRTGRKYAEGFKKGVKIVFDDILPKWNYRAVPSRP